MHSANKSPWALLGIAPGAGTAEIRRAYAKRLKEIRPDGDAQEFQGLVDARDQALRLASGSTASARRARSPLAGDTDGALRTQHEPASVPRNIPLPPELSAADPPVEVQLESRAEISREIFHIQHEPASVPRDIPLRPELSAADPPVEVQLESRAEISREIFHVLQHVLAADELAGWQTVTRNMIAVPYHDRAAIEVRFIESLSAFAAEHSNNYACWPPGEWPSWPANKWPFFDLVLALSEEFGWNESDRELYEVLDEDEAQHFTALLRWARNVSPMVEAFGTDVHSQALPQALGPIALQDLHSFYDCGRDQLGLNSYWAMLKAPTLWRPTDAPTYLFFPVWSWREGHYARSLLGLLGWTALIMAFAPWRLETVIAAMPWLLPLPAKGLLRLIPLLPMLMGVWYLTGSSASPPVFSSPGGTNARAKFSILGPRRSDRLAFFLFPFWAFVRGLYCRAAVGLVAWIAIAYQIYAYPDVLQNHQKDLGFISAVILVLLLHVTAGAYGQRWVVYKLRRAIVAADRLQILEPGQRAEFLRRRGTRDFTLWTGGSHQRSRRRSRTRLQLDLAQSRIEAVLLEVASGIRWKWAVLLGAAVVIIRLIIDLRLFR
jgi:hypothetical protein